jgi:ABC-type sugar transport system substrate-binding protein
LKLVGRRSGQGQGPRHEVGVVGIAGVEEAVRAVLAGDMVGTAGIDAVEQGGRGLAVACSRNPESSTWRR